MKKIYGYSRVSTMRQAKQGTSLEAQESQVRQYADYKLVPLGFVWAGQFRDSAHSGSKPLLDRPSGRELSMTVEPGDAVIISRLDRGFRNLKDCLITLDRWKERGVDVHLLDLSCDTGTPIGRLIVGVLGAVAEFESAWRNERVRIVVEDLKARGYFVGPGNAPYGFKTIGPRGRKKIIPDNSQRELARKFIEWKSQGWGAVQIWRHCWTTGIRWNQVEITVHRINTWVRWELALQAQEAQGLKPRPVCTGPAADPSSLAHVLVKDMTPEQRRRLRQNRTA